MGQHPKGVQCVRGADVPRTGRGGAAAVTWICRGGDARRRRGREAALRSGDRPRAALRYRKKKTRKVVVAAARTDEEFFDEDDLEAPPDETRDEDDDDDDDDDELPRVCWGFIKLNEAQADAEGHGRVHARLESNLALAFILTLTFFDIGKMIAGLAGALDLTLWYWVWIGLLTSAIFAVEFVARHQSGYPPLRREDDASNANVADAIADSSSRRRRSTSASTPRSTRPRIFSRFEPTRSTAR